MSSLDQSIFVQGLVLPLAFETIFYGIYVCVAILSTRILCRQLHHARIYRLLLVANLFMFTVATAWWSLDIALYNIKLQLILGQTTSLSDLGVARVRIAQQYLPLANYALNDAVVVWRAWVLSESKLRKWINIASIVTALVIFSLLIASATIPNGWKAVTHAGMTMTPAGFLAGVAFGITLITNLWATGIIGWRAWSHHRLWNQARPGMALSKRQLRYFSPPGFVQRVMMLLVESGAIYCAIWLAYMITYVVSMGSGSTNLSYYEQSGTDFNASTIAVQQIPNSPVSTFVGTLNSSIVHIAGIYPAILIVLVCLQKEVQEDSFPHPDDFSHPGSPTPSIRYPYSSTGTHSPSNSLHGRHRQRGSGREGEDTATSTTTIELSSLTGRSGTEGILPEIGPEANRRISVGLDLGISGDMEDGDRRHKWIWEEERGDTDVEAQQRGGGDER